MFRALAAGDSTYDGVFVAAVRTTSVFCRPSCRARKPRPENVEYFSSPREAIREGYRPCRRCRPLELGETPAWVRTLLEAVDRGSYGEIGRAHVCTPVTL